MRRRRKRTRRRSRSGQTAWTDGRGSWILFFWQRDFSPPLVPTGSRAESKRCPVSSRTGRPRRVVFVATVSWPHVLLPAAVSGVRRCPLGGFGGAQLRVRILGIRLGSTLFVWWRRERELCNTLAYSPNRPARAPPGKPDRLIMLGAVLVPSCLGPCYEVRPIHRKGGTRRNAVGGRVHLSAQCGCDWGDT